MLELPVRTQALAAGVAETCADSGNIARLLQQSGRSSGALDAIQAGNLLSGQVASQLMKMNQQMAATNQAQMNWIAQQTQLLAQTQQTTHAQLAGYTTRGARSCHTMKSNRSGAPLPRRWWVTMPSFSLSVYVPK